MRVAAKSSAAAAKVQKDAGAPMAGEEGGPAVTRRARQADGDEARDDEREHEEVRDRVVHGAAVGGDDEPNQEQGEEGRQAEIESRAEALVRLPAAREQHTG